MTVAAIEVFKVERADGWYVRLKFGNDEREAGPLSKDDAGQLFDSIMQDMAEDPETSGFISSVVIDHESKGPVS